MTDYVPMRRGEWPTDRAEGKAEFARRFPELVAALRPIVERYGSACRLGGAVNVLGDEWGDVTDEMRRDVHRVDEAPAADPGVTPQHRYRGKQKPKR